jgi:aspartate/tyrosine/aromatic aminotransferase
MLSVITPSPEIKATMQKQMALLARSETGSIPTFGAKIVEVALGDEKTKATLTEDVKGIAAELRRRRRVWRRDVISWHKKPR